jgi:hypothetical protein
MAAAGTGIFFDGVTSARRPVLVELARDGVVVRDAEERDMLARWPYDELDHLAAPDGVLRLAHAGSRALARLEVRDPCACNRDRRRFGAGRPQRRGRTEEPPQGDRLEYRGRGVAGARRGVRRSGARRQDRAAGAAQRRALARRGGGHAGAPDARQGHGRPPVRVRWGNGEAEGRAALGQTDRQAGSGRSLADSSRREGRQAQRSQRDRAPGGHIYVFEGLVDKAESTDELAGVIAHEVGHVAHRDGTRTILQSAGLSFLFGMLLGDFVGGGAVVIGARAVLQSSYSREVEGAADRYGAELMNRAGGDVRALGVILTRLAGALHPGVEILSDHPDTKARVAVINTLAAPSAPSQSLLEPAEWRALKRICTGR